MYACKYMQVRGTAGHGVAIDVYDSGQLRCRVKMWQYVRSLLQYLKVCE
jgi:hypothetical protein